jgi:LysM repeat protein
MKYIVPTWASWETIDTIASRFGITLDQLLNANPILNSVPVRPGMVLEVPGPKGIDLPRRGISNMWSSPMIHYSTYPVDLNLITTG